MSDDTAHLPFTDITQKELDELLEYSCSLPTGTTPGKRWKRDLEAYAPKSSNVEEPVADLEKQMRGKKWIIGEFFEPDEAFRIAHGLEKDDIGIRWTRPRIIPK